MTQDAYTPHDSMDWLDVNYVTIEMFRSMLTDLVNDLPAGDARSPASVVGVMNTAIKYRARSGNVFASGLVVTASLNGFTLLVTHRDQTGTDPLFSISLGNEVL
jgi:hypothetical protein